MSSATLYEQGKLHYQQKKFADAVKKFTEAIAAGPESKTAEAKCYNARGVVYFYTQEFKNVIKDTSKALKLDPDNANYYNCRGNAYFSLGKFGKAADDFSKAIEKSPNSSHGRYFNNRGSAFRRLKQFGDAVKDYTKAISLDPKNGNYFNNRGNTYFDMGEFQLAIDDFTAAMSMEPYSPNTKITLQQAHEALQQEKRMKNSTFYEGVFSYIKDKGKKGAHRKDRVSNIYVSPAGIEATYLRGFLKKRDQVHFEWNEDMKIEILNDESIRLYLDGELDQSAREEAAYIDIQNVNSTDIEEELIGRITAKFASYSTACLVAQHRGVVAEYTSILSKIKQLKNKSVEYQDVLDMGKEQMENFVKEEKFDFAEKAKAQTQAMQKKIDEIAGMVKAESERAEKVRKKAEYESGPVVDMVEIMRKRVEQLSISRKDTSEGGKLKKQLAKMQELLAEAKDLQGIVAEKAKKDIEKRVTAALPADSDVEEMEEDEEEEVVVEEKVEPPVKEETPAPVPEKKEEAPAVTTAEEVSSDEEDWDDLDEDGLTGDFSIGATELLMTLEAGPGGMVTIKPGQADGVGSISAGTDLVMLKRESLIQLTEEQKAKAARLAELERKAAEAESKLSEKEEALLYLEKTNQGLLSIKSEASEVQQRLQEKMAELEKNAQDMSGQLHMTAQQKEELSKQIEEQRKEAQALKGHLDSVNEALARKVQEAEEKTAQFTEIQEKSAELEAAIAAMKSQTDEEKQRAAQIKEEYEAKMADMENQTSSLQEKLQLTAKEKDELLKKVDSQQMTLQQLRRHLNEMKDQLASASEEAERKQAELLEIEEKRKADMLLIDKMKEQQKLEEQKRRQLHNLIQEIKGNIRVYIRLRPDLDNVNGDLKLYKDVIGSDGRGITVTAPKEKSATGGASKSKKYNFEFDRIFWEKDNQEVVFEEISQLIQSALDGFAVSIFAYGQTGSGKTYTMQGPEHLTPETRGVIPRAVEQIFSYRDEIGERDWSYQFVVTFYEIYCDEIRDLLRSTAEDVEHKVVMIEEPGKKKKVKKTIVSNLTEVEVKSAADVMPVLEKASKHRATASTGSNERSSRSHSVFTLRIIGTHGESGTTSEGVLNLVDLAGSERIDKSKVEGQQLEETKSINKSLTCLGDVISALAGGSKHVPFRNSTLTYAMTDSFQKGSKTLMFINLAGEVTHLGESLCSLRFGAKVNDTTLGTAKKNVKAKK